MTAAAGQIGPSPHAPFPQRRTVGVLSASQVIGGIGTGAGLGVAALLIEDVDGSSRWAGAAVVMLTLGTAATSLPLARLARRFGRRPALTLGWTIGAVGAAVVVAAAAAGTVVGVLGGLFIAGASTAAGLQSRFAATDRADPATTGRSLAIVVWATTVGAVAGPHPTGPGADVASVLGLPDLAGAFLFAAAAFGLAAAVTLVGLRPDPLRDRGAAADADRSHHSTVRVRGHLHGDTALGVGAVATAHGVMVAVMALTPVHLNHEGVALPLIGLTISLHIAGMYALSPLMGALTDRYGAPALIVAGHITLVMAAAFAGLGGSHAVVTIALVVLGVGWSASVIAGAALVASSVDDSAAVAVQGTTDLAMNLAGAAGGLLAGVVMAAAGFGALNAAAAALTVPVVAAVVLGRHGSERLRAGAPRPIVEGS